MLCAVAAFSDWHSQGKHRTVHSTDPYLKLGGQVLCDFMSNSTVSGVDVNHSNTATTTTTGCFALLKSVTSLHAVHRQRIIKL